MRNSRWTVVVAACTSMAWACMDATEVDLLEISGTAVLFGQAYLDLDASGALDAGDAPLDSVSVTLSSPGTPGVVREITTDGLGLFILEDVPVGVYELSLDTAVISDSLLVVGAAGPITLAVGDTVRRDLGTAYPELTLAEVRASPPGRRVFTSGIALNFRTSFGDGTVHFQDGGTYLRATAVVPSNLQPGDSVRMLGRTALNAGQPVLDGVTPVVLRAFAALPMAMDVSVGSADAAGGGVLDAALVRIRNAEIGDTTTVNGDLRFWAHLGADSVEVAFRAFLGIAPSPPIRPDTVVRVAQVTGLLTPYPDASGTRWRIVPRGPADVATELKAANIVVSTSFDVDSANVGDTVEIRVVARNAAPIPAPQQSHTAATSVQLADTVPAALTLVSASATRGSYAASTWTIGTLPPGAVDTLRVRARVTGAPGNAVNRARFQGLQLEVETNSGDDLAADTLVIS